MNKPVFMTIDDASNYLSNKTTVCSMEEAQIGPVIHNTEELIEQLKTVEKYDFSAMENFRKKYLTYCDGKSAERVAKYVKGHMNSTNNEKLKRDKNYE